MDVQRKYSLHREVIGDSMKIPLQAALMVGLAAATSGAMAVSSLELKSLAASCANCHEKNCVAQPGMQSLAPNRKGANMLLRQFIHSVGLGSALGATGLLSACATSSGKWPKVVMVGCG